ncbi:hypothetical protein [Paracoccus sp. IB05]|uniref:hypothetical protein n=1 Tax=Paracoccus sp. IB05 TaxID=2779367 RepID=UPI0018E8112A|nr:hypothetical protein [Paracoccus sp. IB05]MBJ2152612.1 hypothetical protein [Paracoccus sp. IB05]
MGEPEITLNLIWRIERYGPDMPFHAVRQMTWPVPNKVQGAMQGLIGRMHVPTADLIWKPKADNPAERYRICSRSVGRLHHDRAGQAWYAGTPCQAWQWGAFVRSQTWAGALPQGSGLLGL